MQGLNRKQPTGAFSVAMVAERWGTSDTFVYDQIKAGRLSAFKLGGKLIRVKPEAIEAYERAGSIEAVPEVEEGTNVHDLGRMIRIANG